MRRWHGRRGVLAIAWQPSPRPCQTFIILHQTRFASSTVKSKTGNAVYARYAVFKKTKVPRLGHVERWAALLDGALPPHLRNQNVSPQLVTLSAVDLAEVLLAAQRRNGRHKGLDLLYHLGFNQGRWSAVVWLIKKIVDRFPVPQHTDASVTSYMQLWDQVPLFQTPHRSRSLWQEEGEHVGYTPPEGPLELDSPQTASTLIAAKSLDELTGSSGSDDYARYDLAHEALGQIWRTLGAMTQACAGGSIRQEVLEIIAYLHHREVMPMAIYQYQPSMDNSAIQQPPLIPLLSTRILTSLSDAAWTAHEKLTLEEARERQGDSTPKRPPVLATPYRARVDGLFPEVWLELILWSCLHGGWVKEGGQILELIAKNEDWKPLSWREHEKALPLHGQLKSVDWNAWDYLFKTRASKSMDPSREPVPEVRQTVSAEVVNAYIDAIPSLPSVAPEPREFNTTGPLLLLENLQGFLNKHNLDLTTGSWDALVLRMVAHQKTDGKALLTTSRIIKLSHGLGQGLTSGNTQDLPAYVLDGSSAMQGILTTLLHTAILAGSLESALEVLAQMLHRTDRDKQTSMTSFMEGSKSLFRALDRHDMFTCNVTGIEYPPFELQIPPATLGLLLDLVIQHKEYEFGRWLLYSQDVDGPIIRREIYHDSFLIAALVRFATATQDAALFRTLQASPTFDLHLVLDAQIDAMRWDAAMGIVFVTSRNEHARKTPAGISSMDHLANLSRVMLSQVPGATAGQAESRGHLESAMKLFSAMVGQIPQAETEMAVRVQSLLDVLSSVDAHWAKFCQGLRRLHGHHDVQLTPPQFNRLLEGVVTAYGSAAGRRLLELFWPECARDSVRGTSKMEVKEDGQLTRIVVHMPGMDAKDRAVLYGSVRPNIQTIAIILQKALEELKNHRKIKRETASSGINDAGNLDGNDIHTPHGLIAWAARRISELPDPPITRDVIYNIDRVLQTVRMEELCKEAHEIVWRGRGRERARENPAADDDYEGEY